MCVLVSHVLETITKGIHSFPIGLLVLKTSAKQKTEEHFSFSRARGLLQLGCSIFLCHKVCVGATARQHTTPNGVWQISRHGLSLLALVLEQNNPARLEGS